MDFKILNELKFHQRFVTSLFAGGDGTISCTRVVMMMLISFVIGMGTMLATRLHANITVPDLVAFMGSASSFIATTCGPLYLINKGGDVINNRFQPPGPPMPPLMGPPMGPPQG